MIDLEKSVDSVKSLRIRYQADQVAPLPSTTSVSVPLPTGKLQDPVENDMLGYKKRIVAVDYQL